MGTLFERGERLGRLGFETARAAVAACQAVWRATPDGARLEGAGERLAALCYAIRRGVEPDGVSHYTVEPHRDHPTRGFVAVYRDGRRDPFSALNAIRFGAEDRPYAVRLAAACRAAVAEQIAAFRARALERCAACGARGDLQVDHARPPFCEIVSDFLAAHGPPALTYAERFADEGEAGRWRAHHAARARLEMLCPTCNYQKGKHPARPPRRDT